VLCPATTCPAVIDGIVLYRDDAHLTNTVVTVSARAGRGHLLPRLPLPPPPADVGRIRRSRDPLL
jgi:hypothetical protein